MTGTLSRFNERGATLLLLLLIAADLAFIVLYIAAVATPALENPLLALQADNGYPEVFQYLKWFWITIILIYVSAARHSASYLGWAAVFLLFLFDDAFRLHELAGNSIAASLNFKPSFGLRPQDWGELSFVAITGFLILAALLWPYMRGSRVFRKVSDDLLLLLVGLIFFGVFMDMVHITLASGWKMDFMLEIIEDGGEMIVASLILWYVFFLALRTDNTTVFLCDWLRRLIFRRSA